MYWQTKNMIQSYTTNIFLKKKYNETAIAMSWNYNFVCDPKTCSFVLAREPSQIARISEDNRGITAKDEVRFDENIVRNES